MLSVLQDLVEDMVRKLKVISILYAISKYLLTTYKAAQYGWITLVVLLEMKYWKTAVASTGEATATTAAIQTMSE